MIRYRAEKIPEPVRSAGLWHNDQRRFLFFYDFQFKLFDDVNVVDGNQVGSYVNIADVEVIDGYFTVELDFGSEVFDGSSV